MKRMMARIGFTSIVSLLLSSCSFDDPLASHLASLGRSGHAIPDDGAEAHPAPDLQDAAYLRSGGDQGPNSRALVSTHSCSSNWDNRGAIRLQQLIIVTD